MALMITLKMKTMMPILHETRHCHPCRRSGLTPDQLTHEKVLELMDVAAQASERPEWIKAQDKAARRRRAVEKEWRTKIAEPQDAYVEDFVKANKGKTAWDEADLYDAATDHYNDSVNQIRTFVLMPRSAQAAELRRLMNTESNSPFGPRQVGPSTNPMEMPAMFDKKILRRCFTSLRTSDRLPTKTS